MKKKVLSMIFIVVLCLCLLPVAALAANDADTGHGCVVPADCLVCDVAGKINALPKAADITIENAAAVTEQIYAIDRVKVELMDEEYEELLALVDQGDNGSGGGLGVPVRYKEAVEAVQKLTGGGSLYIGKKFAAGGTVDVSNATVQFKLTNTSTGAAQTLTLSTMDYQPDSLSAVAGFYSANADGDGWTYKYLLPAGTYRIEEISDSGATVNGKAFVTASTTYTVNGTESKDYATVTVENGGNYTVSVMNGFGITLHANNGTETADINISQGEELAADTFEYLDCEIKSWNTEADGSGDSYAPGATVTGPLDLYAQWVLPLNNMAAKETDLYTWSGNGSSPYTLTLKEGAVIYADVVFPAKTGDDVTTINVNGDCKINGDISFVSGTGQASSNLPFDLTIEGGGSLEFVSLQGKCSNQGTLTVKTKVDITSTDNFFIGSSGGAGSKIAIDGGELTLGGNLSVLETLVMENGAKLTINGCASFSSMPTLSLADDSYIYIKGDGNNYILYQEYNPQSEDEQTQAFDALLTNSWLPAGYSFKDKDWYYYLYEDENTLATKSLTIQKRFTVTVDTAISNGTVTATPSTAAEGTSITLNASPNQGFILETLKYSYTPQNESTVEVDLGSNTTFTMPAADVTVTATFKAITYTVTADEDIVNGTVTVDKTTAEYTKGETVTVTITPEDGFILENLEYYPKDDPTATVTISGNTFTMPEYNVIVTATFKQTQVKISVVDAISDNALAGAHIQIINNSEEVVDENDSDSSGNYEACGLKAGMYTLRISGVPAGYAEVDDTSFVLKADGTIDADKTTAELKDGVLIVKLTPAYTVIFNSDGGSDVDAQTVTHGEKAAKPTDPAKSGYVFKGWTLDGAEYDFSAPVTAPISLTATWEKKQSIENEIVLLYPIVLPDSTPNGELTANHTSATPGTNVTITVTPDEGFVLDKLTVKDRDGNALELTDKGGGKYSFTMPGSKVTVEAGFIDGDWDFAYRGCPKDHTCPVYSFPDAKTTAWYHDGVHFCIDNELMIGYDDGTFRPDGTTTRAMIVTILWRFEGKPVVNYLMQFEDVKSDVWYTEAIRWAASEGVVEGYSDTAFGPNDAITREQFATILWRYAKYKGADVSVGEDTNILSFEDAFTISEYAIPAMQWACGSGLMEGNGVNLTPKANATRAQAAALLMRYCENIM